MMRKINLVEVLLTLLAILVLSAGTALLMWLVLRVLRDMVFMVVYVYLLASGVW